MEIDFPTALAFVVTFCTAILAFFSVLVAYFLGKNVYRYRTELDELGARLSARQMEFEAQFEANSYILSKLEITIFLHQSKDGLMKAKGQVIDYFADVQMDERTQNKLQASVEKFEVKLAARNQEIQLLASGLTEGLAVLNALTIYSGDRETLKFLEMLLPMYESDDQQALINKSIGRLEARLLRQASDRVAFNN